jgi:serine protease AprX
VIASFSSRGPVTVDLSNRLKPNVSAPGVSIRSSTLGGGYGIKSGTSMAGPHVTGLVALLLSANPDLIGQVSEIETIIEQTALPRTTTQTCGNVPGSQIPNNTYGWGRVDAWAAVRSTLVIFYFPIMMK